MDSGRREPMEQGERTHQAALDAWPVPTKRPEPDADEPLEHAGEGEDEPITLRTPTGTPPPAKAEPERR
jgi:hypothetical protein